ncbi:MAG: excinuclease ABC subunit A, partial [Novipirellula sp. JB048]
QSIQGLGQIDDCMLIDQSPISKSARSCPVTYVKAFDAIRKVFAATVEARSRNLIAGHFSFNNAKGRCPECEGAGVLEIDMQFLADVTMRCPSCQGARYRDEILKIRYRDRTIADVLEMSVREAVAFFRGEAKVQARLQRMIDVGLDYIKLGQPGPTLSSGEGQRLKLAAFLAAASRRRTLFILDEPTTGLHFADIVRLVDCFDALIADGHSLIVVEHNAMLMQAADYLIDLGPGAASAGGRVVATGTPAELKRNRHSVTAAVLRAASV